MDEFPLFLAAASGLFQSESIGLEFIRSLKMTRDVVDQGDFLLPDSGE